MTSTKRFASRMPMARRPRISGRVWVERRGRSRCVAKRCWMSFRSSDRWRWCGSRFGYKSTGCF
jgi:hypothetical protein